jgi:hypothetical protein
MYQTLLKSEIAELEVQAAERREAALRREAEARLEAEEALSVNEVVELGLEAADASMEGITA